MKTLEEAAANLADPNICKTDNWIAGAKWMSEKMYRYMQEYAEFCVECDRSNLKLIVAKDWFEQFKKK
jgi:hypothetical protein